MNLRRIIRCIPMGAISNHGLRRSDVEQASLRQQLRSNGNYSANEMIGRASGAMALRGCGLIT